MTQEQDELILMHMDRIDAKMDRMQDLLHEFGAPLTAVELQLLALERDRIDHREALIRARQARHDAQAARRLAERAADDSVHQ